MIITSTAEAVPFTPAWRESDPKAPVYLLRAGSVIERGQLEAELGGRHRAGRVFGVELRDAERSGVQTLLSGDPDQDRVLAAMALEEDELAAGIEAARRGDAAAQSAMSAEDRQLLVEVRAVLEEHWAPYRDLVEQLERRRQLAPILAFRRFCVGWENVEAKHVCGRDGQMTDGALRAIDPLEMAAAGNRAYGMLYAGAEEGNSERAGASGSGPQTSSSDASSTADGTSPANAGAKTPG